MSDLYLALVVLGVMVIIAVVIYNWWQEKHFRREAKARFSQLENDVLMEDNVHVRVRESSMPFAPSSNVAKSMEEEAHTASQEDAQFELPKQNSLDIEHEINLNETIIDAPSHDFEIDQAITSPNLALTEDNFVAEDELVEEAKAEDSIEAFEPITQNTQTEALDIPLEAPQINTNEDALQMLEESGLDAPKAEMPVDQNPQNTLSFPDEIDTQVDFVAILHLPKASNIEMLQDFHQSTLDLDKHKALFALTTNHEWLTINQENSHQVSINPIQMQKVACSIQLADRSGYISKTTLTRFQYEVDKLGHKLAAHIEWLTVGDPWRIASELDQFCIEVDKLVGFHIVQGANGPFTGTKLRGLAEASGLALESDGAFAMNDDQGQRLYSIVNKDGLPFALDTLRSSLVSGVSFQLDIPRVKNCVEVFNQMVLAAKQMETSLGAMLLDDHQKPVGEVQVEKVRQQLKLIHGKMLARGIVPGSTTALRLFL